MTKYLFLITFFILSVLLLFGMKQETDRLEYIIKTYNQTCEKVLHEQRAKED